MSTVTVADNLNEVAEQLIGCDYLSYSAVSTSQRCPLQFYLRYGTRLEEEMVSSALVFGSAIHAAAELHFNELMVGNPAPDLDMLLSVYQEAWSERDLDTIQFNKTDDVDSLGQLAERMLRAFQSSDFAQPNGTILGVEEELRGELVEGCPDLLARVDLLTDQDDALVVTDLKTARSRWSRDQAEFNAEQLLLYSELAGRLLPDKTLRLQFAVVTKTKSPAVEIHEVELDDHRLGRIKNVVRRVWDAIQTGHFYPSPSQMNCSGCPFKKACRAWHG